VTWNSDMEQCDKKMNDIDLEPVMVTSRGRANKDE